MLAETQEYHNRLAEQAHLLDLSNDAIMVRDTTGKIVYWNRGAEEIYGWTRAEALGKVKADLLQTEFPEPLEQINARLLRDGRWTGELIQTRRDGTRIDVATRWALDRDAQGRTSGVLITDNDITGRKQAEQKLRESEERFRTLGDNIAQLAWMADASGAVVWYNKRWYDYTGTTFKQMQGWGWETVHHPDHMETVKAKWKSHLQRGEPWQDAFPLRGKDGQYRWFLSHVVPIKDQQGRIVRWFGTNTDITEQKEFEGQLERLVAARTARLQETVGELEAFSYSISHDMRAPLRAMQGFAKILSEDYKDRLDAEGNELLGRIIRGSNRLDSLIRDVLAYSRVAKADIVLQPINLQRLIEDILPNHPEFQPPSAQIEVQAPLLSVWGHEAYLTQCVTNLLGNAVKFVREGMVPHVRIWTERLSGYALKAEAARTSGGEETVAPEALLSSAAKVRVWFEDNGIGIDPAHQDRIFQIFGQVHPGEKFGGTGIGLAIVRKAAQRMGGDVGVKSELGKGSRFWIILREAEYDDGSGDTVG
jgi:PAS domain S-box-containing protein